MTAIGTRTRSRILESLMRLSSEENTPATCGVVRKQIGQFRDFRSQISTGCKNSENHDKYRGNNKCHPPSPAAHNSPSRRSGEGRDSSLSRDSRGGPTIARVIVSLPRYLPLP